MARQSKPVGVIAFQMLLSDNVFDVERPEKIILLVDSAVFTAISGSLSNEFPRGIVHVA